MTGKSQGNRSLGLAPQFAFVAASTPVKWKRSTESAATTLNASSA